MSLLFIPILFFLMILMVLDTYRVPILTATMLGIVAAAAVWRRWPTTSYWGTVRKLFVLSIMVLAVDGAVILYGISTMSHEDAVPACEALGEKIRLVMSDSAQVDRFQRAMALANTARMVQCAAERRAQVLAGIENSNASDEFSPADIESAWKYVSFSAEKHPDLCDSGLYVALQLRRAGISRVPETIQSFPKNHFWCNARENYISQVKQRCASVWKGRCATELHREALQQMVDDPKMGPMGSELPDLIKDLWGSASVTH